MTPDWRPAKLNQRLAEHSHPRYAGKRADAEMAAVHVCDLPQPDDEPEATVLGDGSRAGIVRDVAPL